MLGRQPLGRVLDAGHGEGAGLLPAARDECAQGLSAFPIADQGKWSSRAIKRACNPLKGWHRKLPAVSVLVRALGKTEFTCEGKYLFCSRPRV